MTNLVIPQRRYSEGYIDRPLTPHDNVLPIPQTHHQSFLFPLVSSPISLSFVVVYFVMPKNTRSSRTLLPASLGDVGQSSQKRILSGKTPPDNQGSPYSELNVSRDISRSAPNPLSLTIQFI